MPGGLIHYHAGQLPLHPLNLLSQAAAARISIRLPDIRAKTGKVEAASWLGGPLDSVGSRTP